MWENEDDQSCICSFILFYFFLVWPIVLELYFGVLLQRRSGGVTVNRFCYLWKVCFFSVDCI